MRKLALIALLSAAAAGAQADPVLWDNCIAVPDPACALSLALVEVDTDPGMTSRNMRLREMAELLAAHGQAAAAAEVIRRIDDPADAVRLWPLVLAQRPVPADVAMATGLAAQIENPVSRRAAFAGIATALVAGGDLSAARGVIDSQAEPLSPAIVALAVAMVHAGDVAGATAMAARVEESWRNQAQSALMIARAEAGDLPDVRQEWNAMADVDRFDVGVGLVPLIASPGHFDRVLALMRDRFGGQGADYFDRRAEALGQALALAPPDYRMRQVADLAAAAEPPERRAAILMAVLRATGDPDIVPLVLSTAEEIADPVTGGIVRIDAAPWADAATRAGLADWAAGLPPADRAYVTVELAAASGDPGMVADALGRLPAYGNEVEQDAALVRMLAAVAAGAEPAAVADLLAAVTVDAPTHDDVVLAVAGPLAANGQADLALRLARGMTYDERRAVALGRIGAATSDGAILAEALGVARAEDMNFYRAEALTAIAAAMLGDPG